VGLSENSIADDRRVDGPVFTSFTALLRLRESKACGPTRAHRTHASNRTNPWIFARKSESARSPATTKAAATTEFPSSRPPVPVFVDRG